MEHVSCVVRFCAGEVRVCMCVWMYGWMDGYMDERLLAGAAGSVTGMCAYVQDGASCLWIASQNGHVEVVKYLYSCGGEALLMLTRKVSLQDVVNGCCSLHA